MRNFHLYIAWRYLFSKKSRNVINLVSGISMVTVGCIAAALVIILSAFNGLEGLVQDSFNVFDPDLRAEPKEGKFFPADASTMERLRAIEGVKYATPVLEENALFVHKTQQHIGFIKGIEEGYFDLVPVDSIIEDGSPVLEQDGEDFGILGRGVAAQLGMNVYNPYSIVWIYLPKRGKINPFKPFNEGSVLPSALFEGQPEYSDRCVFVPLELAQRICGAAGMVTAVELDLEKNASESRIRKEVNEVLGGNMQIRNKYEQHALVYKVMQSEKMFVFLIILLILVIASFNIVAFLTMLVVEKKKDIMVIWSLGADFGRLRRIYTWEGTLVSLVGAAGGMLIGILVCFLQMQTGMVKLTPDKGAPAFPVEFQIMDFVWTWITVIGVGFAASWLRMRSLRMNRQSNYILLK